MLHIGHSSRAMLADLANLVRIIGDSTGSQLHANITCVLHHHRSLIQDKCHDAN